MPDIATSLLNPAPRAALWSVLTDFAAYPEWNPLVLEARGSGAAGEPIDILVAALA
jgi:hypothetical protein